MSFVEEVKQYYTQPSGRAPERPFGTVRSGYEANVEIQSTGELEMAALDVGKEALALVTDFKQKAIDLTNATLDANEKLVNDEADHYGIKTVRTIVPTADCLAGDCKHEVREHSMQKESAGGKDLQEVAQILATRRKEIDDTRANRDRYHHVVNDTHHGESFDIFDPPYKGLDATLKERVASYNALRDSLARQFPVLEQFASLDQSAGDLETLGTKGPGTEMAALVGEQIAQKIDGIKTSRDGLSSGELNVWRLPKMMGLTRAAMQIDAEPWKKNVVDKAVADNQASIVAKILEGIALLALNIGALLLAGPTGGASLVVAAAVNSAVAYRDVKEYILQDALANSSFEAATALSAEKPSLFWLALELVGTAIDVGAAATAISKSVAAFRTLGPLVEAAKVANEGADAERAIQQVAKAAEDLRGASFAKNVVAELRAARKGGTAAELISVGATPKEIDALTNVAKAGDRAVLAETKTLELGEMSGEQVQRELGLAKRGRGVPPDEGYTEAFRLDNGHTWQRSAEGNWCRFSKGACLIAGERGAFKVEPPPRFKVADPAGAVIDETSGLTKEQQAFYRQKIDIAEGLEAKLQVRYERYQARQANRETPGELWPFDKWKRMNPQLRDEVKRGIQVEADAVKAAGAEPKRVTHTFKDVANEGKEVTTITDGIRGKDVVESKYLGTAEVLYDSPQLRAQRDLAKTMGGQHEIVMSADAFSLAGKPPTPRPSGPVGTESIVKFFDPFQNKVTHVWNSKKARWELL